MGVTVTWRKDRGKAEEDHPGGKGTEKIKRRNVKMGQKIKRRQGMGTRAKKKSVQGRSILQDDVWPRGKKKKKDS